MAHHRLFVAFRPPAAIRARLIGLMGGVRGARWQDDAQLHCTLRFIGEIDRHRAEAVATALGSVSSPGLSLSVGPVGTFLRKGRIDTLWAAVEPRDPVAALHERVENALRRTGLPPEGRAFVPHITLARFRRGEAPDAIGPIAVPAGLHFAVGHFELIESHLGAAGAFYETVARYPLR